MDNDVLMNELQYSLAEVAKITGKSEKTISRWIKSGKLPAIRHGTGYLIAEQDIPLKVDPSLDRRNFIQQRLLSPENEEPKSYLGESRRVDIKNLMDVAGVIAGGQVERKQNQDHFSLMFQKHQTEVEKIIREQNELAEKYARATYKIGQLEERNRLLEDQNLKLEQKMTLLPAPEQWKHTRQEVDLLQTQKSSSDAKINELEGLIRQSEGQHQRMQEEKSQLEKEHQELKTALEAERKKSFWQRLFGS
jgi:excisionase family DNA binding protein